MTELNATNLQHIPSTPSMLFDRVVEKSNGEVEEQKQEYEDDSHRHREVYLESLRKKRI